MSDFINNVLQNPYVQKVITYITALGITGVFTIIVCIVNAVKKLKKDVSETLQKKDLKELSKKYEECKEEIIQLKNQLKLAAEYNRLVNDGISILVLNNRRIDSTTKINYAFKVKELSGSETVKAIAESTIGEKSEEIKPTTEEEQEEVTNTDEADVVSYLLNKLGS